MRLIQNFEFDSILSNILFLGLLNIIILLIMHINKLVYVHVVLIYIYLGKKMQNIFNA